MRGKMYRALIRAINTHCTGRLGSVSAAGESLGKIGVTAFRGQVRQFLLLRKVVSNERDTPIIRYLRNWNVTVSLTRRLKAEEGKGSLRC